MELKTGKNTKLKISVLSDSALCFVAMFNPDSYTMSYEDRSVTHDSATSPMPQPSEAPAVGQASGAPPKGSTNQNAGAGSDMFTLNLTLDGTGVHEIGAANVQPVQDRVRNLFHVAYDSQGNARQLRVCWGVLDFECKLANIDVKYTLFERGGIPLRAELTLKFRLENHNWAKKIQESPQNSTSNQVVMAEDSLPRLTEKAYGSPEMYLEVAAFNGLDDFRNLIPGTTLVFPPLAVLKTMIVVASPR